MTESNIEVGERYTADELPDNAMNKSGKLEWVSDDVLALSHDGNVYEFRMAVECTAIYDIKDGEMELIAGEKR